MTESDLATPVRLAIVGHIDHGKSTLIGRFLYGTRSLPDHVLERMDQAGSDELQLEFITDHLKEERRDAKTIETTQVFFRFGGRHYVIIDTPGHAEFLKNMFTGASRADAALMVVDAAEGVQRQTLAHCNVLGLLGVTHVVPVVNKMDRVDYAQARFAEVAAAIRERIQALGIEPQPPVPISALRGANVVAAPSDQTPWYDGPPLLDTLAAIPDPTTPDDKPLRFAVQGTFDVDGQPLALGRVEAGILRAGAAVRLLPAGADATVESIRTFDGPREQAGPGASVGIGLAGAQAPARGTIVCDPTEAPDVTERLVGRLFWLSDEPLAAGDELEVRIATQDIPGRVERITQSFHASSPDDVRPEADGLDHGDIARVEIPLASPIAFEPFARDTVLGRFVLARRGDVVGAGTVA